MGTALSDILSGSKSAASSESTATPEPAAPAAAPVSAPTDVKPASEAKAEPATAATSAAQTSDQPAAPTGEKPVEKPTDDTRARDENGRFVKMEEQIAGLQKGIESERKKRQEVEAREKRDAEARAAASKEPAKLKDFWENPDEALTERLSPQLAKITQDNESRLFGISEYYAKRDHANYDEVVNELMSETAEDTTLANQVYTQMRGHPSPAEALYSIALNRRELKAVGGDLSKYKDTITEPLRKEHETLTGTLKEREAEITRLKAQLDNVSKVPDSLNAGPSASGASPARSQERTPLAEIVKPKKRRA